MLRPDAAAAANDIGAALLPVAGKGKIALGVEIGADVMKIAVGLGILGLRWESVGIAADLDVGAKALQLGTCDVNGIPHDFGLTAIELQCRSAQFVREFGRLNDAFTRS